MTERTEPRHPILEAIFKNRFVGLLVVILGGTLAMAFVQDRQPVGETHKAAALMGGLFMLMLVVSLYAVSGSVRTVAIACALAAPVVAPWVIGFFVRTRSVEIIENTFGALFLGYVVLVMLQHIFTVRRVTVNIIAASLCVYLLLGLFWGEIYALLEIFSPGSFTLNVVADEGEQIRFGRAGMAYSQYFSFVTMSTLGYGDIVPMSMQARYAAALQAVTGQMYLAVLVARLVGLHIVHSAGGSEPPGETGV